MKLNKEEIKAIKLKAKNEFNAAKTEIIIEELKGLYEKRARAEKVLDNIKREIEDYEMQLEE